MKQVITHSFEEGNRLYYVSPQGEIQTITIEKQHLEPEYPDYPTKALVETYRLQPQYPVETFENSQVYLWETSSPRSNRTSHIDYHKRLAPVFIKEEDAQAYAEKIQTKIKIETCLNEYISIKLVHQWSGRVFDERSYLNLPLIYQFLNSKVQYTEDRIPTKIVIYDKNQVEHPLAEVLEKLNNILKTELI